MLRIHCKKNILEFGSYLIPGEGPRKHFQKYTTKSSFWVTAGGEVVEWSEEGREEKSQVRENADTPLKNYTRPYLDF